MAIPSIDCTKDALLFICENVHKPTSEGRKVMILSDVSCNDQLRSKYSKEDLEASVIYLGKSGYILLGDYDPKLKVQIHNAKIKEITATGSDLIVYLNNDEIWNNAKKAAKPHGDIPFNDFITILMDEKNKTIESIKASV